MPGKVYAAYYQQRNGCDVGRVFASEASMRAWRDELARESWWRLFQEEPCPEEPGDRYFERAADLGFEAFIVEHVEVEP